MCSHEQPCHILRKKQNITKLLLFCSSFSDTWWVCVLGVCVAFCWSFWLPHIEGFTCWCELFWLNQNWILRIAVHLSTSLKYSTWSGLKKWNCRHWCMRYTRLYGMVWITTCYLIAGLVSAKKQGDFGIFSACIDKNSLRFKHLVYSLTQEHKVIIFFAIIWYKLDVGFDSCTRRLIKWHHTFSFYKSTDKMPFGIGNFIQRECSCNQVVEPQYQFV